MNKCLLFHHKLVFEFRGCNLELCVLFNRSLVGIQLRGRPAIVGGLLYETCVSSLTKQTIFDEKGLTVM
jgi:hypothetical protein